MKKIRAFLATAIRQGIKGTSWKKRSKTVAVCRCTSILYVKILRCHQNAIAMNAVHEVAGCNINTQKYVDFYTLIINYQEKIKTTIPFTTASKRVKYLRNNLRLDSENYKILMKEIKDNTNK